MQFHNSTVQTSTSTRLGTVRLAASALGLAGLWFDGQRHQPAQINGPHAWPHDPQQPVLVAAMAQLHEYLDGKRTQFDVPLDLGGGTPFQQAVWRALLGIECGHTTSYAALGEQLGRPAAVRAVGAAVGRNPVSIVVPCHRVLGKNGALTGYAGGLDRKAALLQLEGVWQSPAPLWA